MTPYAAYQIEPELRDAAMADLQLITTFLATLPETPPEGVGLTQDERAVARGEPARLWTCHGLVRGLHTRFASQFRTPWEVEDGFYGPDRYTHSWLTHGQRYDGLILDVYPIGALTGPQLWHANGPASRIFLAARFDRAAAEAEAAALATL